MYQLRPIKGTVRKGPHITRAVPKHALKGSRKEVADDLHGAVGENMEVKQVYTVDEYKTIWQLPLC
ncbi:hypothetical protein DEU56DRAFT_920241 [Suillus clintonianus]|uniref:uncharacterized protein n=1 Tax=Suillus clintonianus TaxID=1904413 RepID=UPI001B86C1AC|nr:uncharacterized protein DEU56DRAFT_920241 [Suillus clintonianus]KAG2110094.1 hypothetical protein DEU56DRAFT_920241 [Suillus clintonianus]